MEVKASMRFWMALSLNTPDREGGQTAQKSESGFEKSKKQSDAVEITEVETLANEQCP